MSRNKQARPYELPGYLKQMQAYCTAQKDSREGYEESRAVGNLHHEISTLWTDIERKLGMLELTRSEDPVAFLNEVEATFVGSLNAYLDTHIEKMDAVATRAPEEVVALDTGTSYLSMDYLILPAFDNENHPYDAENEAYYSNAEADEERRRLRVIANGHRDFLTQFRAEFSDILGLSADHRASKGVAP